MATKNSQQDEPEEIAVSIKPKKSRIGSEESAAGEQPASAPDEVNESQRSGIKVIQPINEEQGAENEPDQNKEGEEVAVEGAPAVEEALESATTDSTADNEKPLPEASEQAKQEQEESSTNAADAQGGVPPESTEPLPKPAADEVPSIRPVPDDLNPDAQTPGNASKTEATVNGQEAAFVASVPQTDEFKIKNRFKKPKGFGVGKKVATIFAALLVVAGLGYGAFAYYQMQQPENQVKAAMARTFGADSFEYTLDISVQEKNNSDDGLGEQISASAKGKFSQGSIELVAEYPIEDSIVAGFEARLIDTDFYFKFTNIKENLEKLEEDASQVETEFDVIEPILKTLATFEDQWIELNAGEIGDIASEEDAEESLENREQDRKKLAEILKKSSLFKIDETLGEQQVNGAPARGYKISPDKEGIDKFVDEVEQAEIGSLEEADFERMKKDLEEYTTNEENTQPTLEVWISDGYIVQSSITFDDEYVSGSLTVGFSRFNEQIAVSAPTDTVSFEEFIQALFTAFFAEYETEVNVTDEPVQVPEETRNSAKDTEVRTDINSIHSHLELYYADNGYYPAEINTTTLSNLSNESFISPSGDPYFFDASTDNGVAGAGAACTTAAKTCGEYRLYGELSDGSNFERFSLNGTP